MSSRSYRFYGWAFGALAVVNVVAGNDLALFASAYVNAMVAFAVSDILKALGK